MKKELKNAIASIEARLKKNTLSEDAAALWEEVKSAFEALADDEAEHNITELNDKFNELAAKYEEKAAEQGEEVAERIQKLRNEVMGMVKSSAKIEDRITPAIREEIANAIASNIGNKSAIKNAVMGVCKKNDIADLDFSDVLKVAVSFEHKPTELFDSFGRTEIGKHYLVGIDETNAEQIAHQWTDSASAEKELQELTAEGITISTKYIYKMQRMANEAIDDAREAGALATLEAETSRELEQQVKRLGEKAAIVGDNYNTSGNIASTFQTIGTITSSTTRVTVVNPVTAGTVTLYDLANAADQVDAAVNEKVCVISKDAARSLSVFTYADGGSQAILSDAELAAQIGVDRLIKVDYLSEVTGLHAVILKPSAYKVRVKNEVNVAFPEYRNNSLYYLYEMNMGGALVEIKSAAVLREA